MSRTTIAVSSELHDYLVRHSRPAPDDVLLDLANETAQSLPDHVTMQIAPEQGAFMTLLTKLVGSGSPSRSGPSRATRRSASPVGSRRVGGCCAATSARSSRPSPAGTGSARA